MQQVASLLDVVSLEALYRSCTGTAIADALEVSKASDEDLVQGLFQLVFYLRKPTRLIVLCAPFACGRHGRRGWKRITRHVSNLPVRMCTVALSGLIDTKRIRSIGGSRQSAVNERRRARARGQRTRTPLPGVTARYPGKDSSASKLERNTLVTNRFPCPPIH